MSISVRFYVDENDSSNWDFFCRQSHQATFLHTRTFLSYHRERFLDRSLIIYSDEKWLGVLPAASLVDDLTSVISHPGATYGGIVHRGHLTGKKMVLALEAVCRFYCEHGVTSFRYKAVPFFYHTVPAQDDLYAFFYLNAHRYRCDLSSTIDLASRQSLNERRRRSLKKAQKSGVVISQELLLLPEFWGVLSDNLEKKYETKPVHTLDEIKFLLNIFSEEIKFVLACYNNKVIAGVILFVTTNCYHTQYIAASEEGYQLSALDLIFNFCIETAIVNGKRWLDFGISNEKNGRLLNDGLYSFKTEFGGGGTVHEFYEFDLAVSNYADQ